MSDPIVTQQVANSVQQAQQQQAAAQQTTSGFPDVAGAVIEGGANVADIALSVNESNEAASNIFEVIGEGIGNVVEGAGDVGGAILEGIGGILGGL